MLQIPALVRPGLAVVVSPLIALMQDQVAGLKEAGVRAEALNSSLDWEEAQRIEQLVRTGDLDLLYLAPERLLTERCLALLGGVSLSLFAIDEAHCVSQWGHDFRPEYIQLSVLARRFPGVPRVALTATADEQTRDEIVARLELDAARIFISSFDRPNIRYRIGEKDNPRRQLLEFLKTEHDGDAGIVYCLSRASVDDAASWLSEQGVRALPYHAGLDCPHARAAPAPLHPRRRHCHGRDHRLWHGHRQTGCALCRAPGHAQEYRGVLPGNRTGGTGRPAGRCLDGLRALRHRAVAAHDRAVGRGANLPACERGEA
ncbi:MAG: RecQ family ATP-dependent DNA helicase [Steroidobacteraceae bacterium]